MVSSGTVTKDLNEVVENLNTYDSQTGNLGGSWKGPSYDSLSSQMAEVSGEYSSTIENGRTNFASACDEYKVYLERKTSLLEAQKAVQDNQSKLAIAEVEADKVKIQSVIDDYIEKAEELKGLMEESEKNIKAYLEAASSTVLQASPKNISGGGVMVGSANVGATLGELTSSRLGANGRPTKTGFFAEKNNIYDLNRGQSKEGGNCTYYTWARASELIGKPLVDSGHQWGNAGTWYDNCTQYNKGSQPKLGAIAVWKGGRQGWGHVAVVEKIDSDGTIHTSEGAWSSGTWYKNGKYSKSNNYTAYGSYRLEGFIYPNEPKKGIVIKTEG